MGDASEQRNALEAEAKPPAEPRNRKRRPDDPDTKRPRLTWTDDAAAVTDVAPPAVAPEPAQRVCAPPPALAANYVQIPDASLAAMLSGESAGYFTWAIVDLLHIWNGMHGFECTNPTAFPLLRARIIADVGRPAFDWVYEHDAEILPLVMGSAKLKEHAYQLATRFEKESLTVAAATAYSLAEQYEVDYSLALIGFQKAGANVIYAWHLILDDVDAQALHMEEDARAEQADADARAAEAARWKAIGETVVGQTIATKEVWFWWDDDVTLSELATPEDGIADWDLAIAWARLAGHATAIVELQARYFVYTLNENYDYGEIWETSSFEGARTALVPEGSTRTRAVVTSDGYVITPRDQQRFFGGYQSESRTASRNLLADLQIAEEQGAAVDPVPLVRQIALDMLMLRLADAEERLHKARVRIHPGYVFDPREGEALQDRTEELRFHIVEAAQLAFDASDPPLESEREAMEDELAEIGRITSDDPVAASMIVNRRDKDAPDRPTDPEYANRLAGKLPGDALQLALDEIDAKLANIEKTRRFFYGHPNAVFGFSELIDAARQQLPESQQFAIDWGLFFQQFESLMGDFRSIVKEAALFGVGLIAGESWIGLAVWGYSALRGAQSVQEGFENADRIAAMTNIDFAGGLQLATPEEAASAQRWAWIGLGLAVIDGCMFVRSATHMLRLSSIMGDPELASVLRYTGRPLGSIAQDLGMSERRLVSELAAARGSARDHLLERIRALQPIAPAWHTGWKLGEAATDETIRAETVQMELHPDYEFRLQAARDRGFNIEFTTRDPHVATSEIVDEQGNVLSKTRTLYLQPKMRFLDLEHEMGHIEQLERLGYPSMHRSIRLPSGALATAKGAPGLFTTKMDKVTEYHNRLSEFARLRDRVPRDVLADEYQGIQKYRTEAETAGLGRPDRAGNPNTLTQWAQEHFPEIPELEQIVRDAGFDLKPKTSRW